MTDMTCPNCSGTGYTQDAAGEDVVCPLCDGTGVLVTEEGDAGTIGGARLASARHGPDGGHQIRGSE
jgi:DnaJ-class molecular chaperone